MDNGLGMLTPPNSTKTFDLLVLTADIGRRCCDILAVQYWALAQCDAYTCLGTLVARDDKESSHAADESGQRPWRGLGAPRPNHSTRSRGLFEYGRHW